jgi:hypothetical protein
MIKVQVIDPGVSELPAIRPEHREYFPVYLPLYGEEMFT